MDWARLRLRGVFCRNWPVSLELVESGGEGQRRVRGKVLVSGKEEEEEEEEEEHGEDEGRGKFMACGVPFERREGRDNRRRR
ncbi:hypothetical protein OIU78_019599 [Salix suchowensis]|nr:hypothetical protein OIU78_019599 [Salix suchowensis]